MHLAKYNMHYIIQNFTCSSQTNVYNVVMEPQFLDHSLKVLKADRKQRFEPLDILHRY